MAHVWRSTTDITTNPLTFIGKEISIGSNYSLVTTPNCVRLDETLFQNYKILDTVCKNDTIYVLVEVNSMEKAKQLQSSLIFKGMTTLPDFYNSQTYQTVSYMVTANLPDGSVYTFSQLLPILM